MASTKNRRLAPEHHGRGHDIPADARFVVAVPYQPAGCRARKLYVEAVPLDDPIAPAVATSRTRLRGHDCRREFSHRRKDRPDRQAR